MVLPYLPPEIWDIIFDIKTQLELRDSKLSFREKWDLGWRPKGWIPGDWIKIGQDKRWNELSFMGKLLWTLGLKDEPKLVYWDNIPTWKSLFI